MWTVSKESLSILQSRLENLHSFLQSKSELTNAHLVDFFTENLWDKLIHKDLQEELLSLSDTDLASLPSTSVLLKDRSSTFPTSDSNEEAESKPEYCYNDKISSNFCVNCENTVKSPLQEFRREVSEQVLGNSGICAGLEEVLRTLGVDLKKEGTFVKEHMCAKKSHEVEVLSGVVAGLCQACHVDQVVDIGSGKGYLSECLYLQHQLTVLGVDASDTNTQGARKRSQLLEKQWTGLVNRTRTDASIECCNTSNVSQPIREAVTKDTKSSTADKKCCSAKQQCETMQQQDGQESVTEKQTAHLRNVDKNIGSKQGSFLPITAYINPDTDLAALVGIKDGVGRPANLRLLLTGLHTCGDLCPTMLHLFVTCPHASVLCSVGCCYNLLTEQGEQGAVAVKCGFPLSQVLQETGAHLGRTARMLACQAVERMGAEGRLPSMSLFYRAVLQVIIRDKFGYVDKEKTVGKVAAKSKDFADYVRRALRKLQIEDAHLSEKEINSYFQQYQGQLKHLQAFVQLRTCLAPCIEALILLDRLCFLHEQRGVSHAALVPVFDPVISPRCYALVALKSEDSSLSSQH